MTPKASCTSTSTPPRSTTSSPPASRERANRTVASVLSTPTHNRVHEVGVVASERHRSRTIPRSRRHRMTNEHDVAGPVDFVLLEFDDATASTAPPPPALLDLVDRGIVTVLDLLVIRKDADGSFSRHRDRGPHGRPGRRHHRLRRRPLGPARRRRPGRRRRRPRARHHRRADRLRERLGRPFVAAVRNAGGEVVASARIPADAVNEALELLDAPTTEGERPCPDS